MKPALAWAKMSDYHEPPDELDSATRDLQRALSSFKEEIEAVGWYTQRIACCKDRELAGVLEHNRNEEIEHACMALEWLRRRYPEWNSALSMYLFSSGDLLAVEKTAEQKDAKGGGENPKASSAGRGLGVGALRGEGS